MSFVFRIIYAVVVVLVLIRYKSYLKDILSLLQLTSSYPDKARERDIQTLVHNAAGRYSQGVIEPEVIILPDLFVSWAKIPLTMNPHYEMIGPLAMAWFNRAVNRGEREARKWAKAKIPCFAGLWLPEALAEEYQTVIDFLNWIWAWDDRIDEGELDKQPELIKIEIDNVLEILTDFPDHNPRPKHPINHVLQSVWERMVMNSSKGTLNRFREAMKEYMDQVLEQAQPGSLAKSTDMESFIINHRGSSGAKIIVHISEYANGLDVPDFVFEHPAIKRIRELQPEHFLLANDIYSYARESKFGHHHNIIHILRTQGMTQQEAFDHVAEAVVARYQEWDDMVAQVPRWGDAIDAQVQKFIEGARLTIVAHLEWSFLTERYFGAHGDVVRRTRRVAPTSMY